MIRDRKDELRRLHAKYSREDAPRTNAHQPPPLVSRSDDEIVEKARSEKNGKFDRLWRGDLSDYDHDHSAADDGFVHKLWSYTQDEEQIRRIHATSGLHRLNKSGCRQDYLQRSIERARQNVSWFYEWPDSAALSTNGHHKPSSHRPVPIGVRTMGRKPEVLRLASVKPPGPRSYVVDGLLPAAYSTVFHGDGGVAKSMLALALGVDVAGDRGSWLGRRIEGGPVLYLDFELTVEEQARRVWQLCRGAGLAAPPDSLLYVSAVGYGSREAFDAARQACEEHNVRLLIWDSLGPTLQGDAEAARDVIGFFHTTVEPLREMGVANLIVDRQSKLQAGQSYQQKSAFGSVYKTNLARSVIQAEAAERDEGTLTIRLRQKKHNFGPLAKPFGVKVSFSEEAVGFQAVELGAAELAQEATLTATERVKLALANGPAYPWEAAEMIEVPLKTVKNALTGLRKQGVVEATGEKDGRADQVRLIVPTSQPYIDTGRRDDSNPPTSGSHGGAS